MRVISGTARGHKLFAPDGLLTRPTADRVKESLFNIIAADLYGCLFLDLFSGTGAIGIEALSRGAEKACFVDTSAESVKCIERNLIKTGLHNKSEIINTDVNTAIKKFGNRKSKFDIIFLDPPYSDMDFNIDLIAITGILNNNGYVVIERGGTMIETEYFNITRIKEYKTAKLIFLSIKEVLNNNLS